MSDELVLCDVAEQVAVLTLNRPGATNALSDAMLAALKARLEAIAVDQAIKVVVIRGAGKVFCGGHDLKEMQAGRAAVDGGAAYFADLFTRCGALMQMIPAMPQPVIAQVHGIATAAGCQLVASCDLAICTDTSSFATPGVNIGLFCSTPMVALTRNVHRKQAMEMLLTGEQIDAGTAKEFGLVNRIVPKEYLAQVVQKYAEVIASKSPLTLKTGKEAFYHQAEMSLPDAYDYCANVMVQNMLFRDAEEGINAFLQKRKPEWTGE